MSELSKQLLDMENDIKATAEYLALAETLIESRIVISHRQDTDPDAIAGGDVDLGLLRLLSTALDHARAVRELWERLPRHEAKMVETAHA